MHYGIALKEKSFVNGLSRNEVIELFDMLKDVEAYPIEIQARYHECSAMGFITPETAELFDYDYETSGLHEFIADVLDDVNNQSENNEYDFDGVKIYISR